MVAGESNEFCNVTGLSTNVAKKNIFKMEMQICKLRDEIKGFLSAGYSSVN